MNIYQMYNDLTIEIAIIEEHIERYQRERDRWWIGGDLFAKHALDASAEHTDTISYMIERLTDMLDARKQSLERINGHIGQLQGLEHKVAFKRYCEGKTLAQIAEELDYSLDYIKEISARVKLKEPS